MLDMTWWKAVSVVRLFSLGHLLMPRICGEFDDFKTEGGEGCGRKGLRGEGELEGNGGWATQVFPLVPNVTRSQLRAFRSESSFETFVNRAMPQRAFYRLQRRHAFWRPTEHKGSRGD